MKLKRSVGQILVSSESANFLQVDFGTTSSESAFEHNFRLARDSGRNHVGIPLELAYNPRARKSLPAHIQRAMLHHYGQSDFERIKTRRGAIHQME